MKELIVSTLLLLGLLPTGGGRNNIPGISGMAPIDGTSYLVIVDTKAHKDGVRIGVLSVPPNKPNRFMPIQVDVLQQGPEPANDLESIHKIPGRDDEHLAAESGRRRKGRGRVFHLAYRRESQEVIVLADWPLPQRVAEPTAWGRGDGDNYEGLACLALGENRFQLVLGERGGSQAHPRGALISGVLNLDLGELCWLPPENDIALVSPGKWARPGRRRDVTALWYDERDGSLWCASSEDPGDTGPFRSVLWRVATVADALDGNNPRTLTLMAVAPPAYVIDGHKVEAISAAPESIPGAWLSFGTEDEDYGGAWRPLARWTD